MKKNASLPILILFLIFQLFQLQTYSQEKFIRNIKAATFFGFKNITRDSFPNNENLDFVNYLYSEKEYLDYDYLGFSAQFDFAKCWSADIKFSMLDDFLPNNFNITAQYLPLKFVGVNFGFHGFSQMMNEFSSYHKIQNVGFEDTNSNYRQRFVFDYGLMCGVVLKKNFWQINTALKLNIGTSSIKPFEESVTQKEINSNKRVQVNYQTLNNFNLFWFPELEVGIDCISFEKSTLGIQFQCTWYASKKSIDYQRITYQWTKDNYTTSTINGSKHNYKKGEFDFGIFLRW